MFTHYRTQGFILKKNDREEANQLLTVYTEDFGKLKIFARAIRKISSKLRSGAELFYLSEIEFIQGKKQKTLTDAILINNFKNIRKDLTRLSVAYKISDVLDGLIEDEEPDEKIWHLLKETFESLNNWKIELRPKILVPGEIIYYYFLWNFFSLLGYHPELYNCSRCRQKLASKKLYFSAEQGGIICQNCFKKVKLGQEIDKETIKILRVILARNRATFFKLKIEKSHLKSLNAISDYYLSQIK